MIPKRISCLFRRLTKSSSRAPIKKKSDPTAALERLEWWSWRATIIILLGIAIEGWNAIHFRAPGETGLEVFTKLAADVLVGLGLAIEAVCILRAIVETRKEKRESDERIAKANERASQAALELERLKTPRVLTTPQALALSQKLLPFSDQAVTVVASPRTFEAASLADQLARMLGMAGTNVRRQDHWATFDPGVTQGIAVCFMPGNEKSERFGRALAESLKAEGFDAESRAADSIGRATPDWVLIVVGEKPMPPAL
jgi:hypothetical protein